MHVHVLHHGRCFDGAASAALFAAFMRSRHGAGVELAYIPKHHKTGDPFVDADFAGADEVGVVDFRYTQHPDLTWYFDHHLSAFQLPGDRAHFEADASGQRFHDAAAPSCAGYLAKVTADRFGFDTSAHAELIRWAEIIDSAGFESPEVAIRYEEPALRLAAWIQVADEPAAIARFIEALQVTPFATLARADWVEALVEPRLADHRRDIELIRRLGRTEAGVFGYDLLDEAPRILSHFIPYYLAPEATYAVGCYAHPDGDLRVTVGFNPWNARVERTHDLARLCERHGGGGHPYVAGISFPADADGLARLRTAQADIFGTLRGA